MTKVLYVEDHRAQRDILAQMLRLNGFEVDVASNGPEGIEKARSGLPDIILMDSRMFGMDGFEAIKILRSTAETRPIPIIAISAWMDEKSKKRAIAAGAQAHFQKPITLDTLLKAINRILETHKPTASHFHNPYIAGPPITNPGMFYGRKSNLEKIINLLPNNFVMLIGPRRIGKTSMLHQLAYHLPKREKFTEQFIPVLVNAEGTSEAEFFHIVMEEIVNKVQDRLLHTPINDLKFDLAESSYSSRFFSSDLQIILKSLYNTSPKPSRLILLLDEMDILNGFSLATQSQLRRILQRFANHNLSVVVAGVKLKQQWAGETSPFYNMFVPVELTPFSKAEARRLITEPVKGIYSYSEKAIDRIIETTSALPHRIQQLCLEIILYLRDIAKGQTEITRDDVDTVLQTIHWLDEEILETEGADVMPASHKIPTIAEKPFHYQAQKPEPDEQGER